MITPATAASVRDTYKTHLTKELAAADTYAPKATMLEKQWTGLVWPKDAKEEERFPDTGVSQDVLLDIGKASVQLPEGFVRYNSLLVFQETTDSLVCR